MRKTDERVLDALRRGPLMRQQIERRLGLGKATVNQSLGRLIAAGRAEVAADEWGPCGACAYRIAPSAVHASGEPDGRQDG